MAHNSLLTSQNRYANEKPTTGGRKTGLTNSQFTGVGREELYLISDHLGRLCQPRYGAPYYCRVKSFGLK